MNIGVAIGTFGDDTWRDRGRRLGAAMTGVAPVAHHHARTLAAARNGAIEALHREGCDWFTIVDADDGIDVGYIDALVAADPGRPALLQPSVSYVTNGMPAQPRIIPPIVGGLRTGNNLIIGTAFHWDSFEAVGGFDEWPLLEDWAFFAAAWAKGADVIEVPAAVYYATVCQGSRNRSATMANEVRVAQEIRRLIRGLAAGRR